MIMFLFESLQYRQADIDLYGRWLSRISKNASRMVSILGNRANALQNTITVSKLREIFFISLMDSIKLFLAEGVVIDMFF